MVEKNTKDINKVEFTGEALEFISQVSAEVKKILPSSIHIYDVKVGVCIGISDESNELKWTLEIILHSLKFNCQSYSSIDCNKDKNVLLKNAIEFANDFNN